MMKTNLDNQPEPTQSSSPKKTRRRFMQHTAGGVFTLTLADLAAPPVRKARAQY